MANDDELHFKVILGVGAFGLVLVGAALVVAVVKAAPQLLTWWVVVAMQLLLVGAALGVAIGVAMWLVKTSTTALVERLARLEATHGELLQAVKHRTPTLLAIALLTGQAALLLADKSFEGNVVQTVFVSMALLLGFWVANELQSAVSVGLRWVGWALWLVTLLYLPVTIAISRHWKVADVTTYVSAFDLSTRLFAGVAMVTLVCAPLLVFAAKRSRLTPR